MLVEARPWDADIGPHVYLCMYRKIDRYKRARARESERAREKEKEKEKEKETEEYNPLTPK